jgi:phospholipid/cholesterol/gamma-HCH transport system substrate-binding protein
MPNRLQVRVGLLVLISLLLLAAGILLLGRERRLFERSVDYRIHFGRTLGLREGAAVNLSGVTVGSVEGLSFPEDIRQTYIVVRVRVAGEVAPRIRRDTVARIRTFGLLGDKYIELSPGSPESAPLEPGSLISSVDPVDYEALLGGGEDALQNIIAVTASLKEILGQVQEGQGVLGELFRGDQGRRWRETGENFRQASASLRNILSSIEKGEGLLGQMVRNEQAGREIVAGLRETVAQAASASRSLKAVADKLERGEGTLGALIQDPDAGKEILGGLRRAAADLEAVSRRLRTEQGLFQRLISDRAYAERVLGHLERTAEDLSRIASKVERGEGTLGALVNDPALYEETRGLMKRLRGSWLLSIFRFFQGLGSSEKERERPDKE